MTAPDGVVTKHEFNATGFETRTIANYVNGTANSDGSGIDDIVTSYTYDHFGRVLTTIADDGTNLIRAKTEQTLDLFGNAVESTTFSEPGGTGPRKTRQFFDWFDTPNPYDLTRSAPTGTQLPVVPAAAAP